MYPLDQQPLSIAEVNTPLTALGFDSSYSLHVKELQCLKLYHQHCTGTRQPHLIFDSYPNLQVLDISLDGLHANELFIILTSNTTLKALRVHLYRGANVYRGIHNTKCPSLKDMLAENRTIQCLAIEIANDFVQSMSFIMSYLTTGLSCNNSLQELSVPIPLPHINNEQLQTYFNVISKKDNLTELKLHLTVDRTSLYYEQVLPLVTNILKTRETIRLLQVQSFSIDERLSKPHWRDSIQQLFQAVLSHPSLEYIGIQQTQLLQDTFKEQKETLYKRSKQPPPIIDIDSFP